MTLLQQALTTIGGLSNPPEMPCYSWGLPPDNCVTGAKLAKTQPNSPCANCYARRGHYRRPAAKKARTRRLACLQKALRGKHAEVDFVHAFAYVLNLREALDTNSGRKDHGYFRWFDSGDLQSKEHYWLICNIATLTPNVEHWLPTRELQFVKDQTPPANLTVRISSNVIGQGTMYLAEGHDWLCYSAIHTEPGQQPHGHIECQSKLLGTHICQTCRDCWDPGLDISYLKR